MKINKKWLKEKEACKEGADWFLEKYGDQGETEGLQVVKDLMADNKPEWANWLIVRIMERKQYLVYAIFAAEQVIDIFEKEYPSDNRPRLAIEAAKKVLEDDNRENRAAATAAADAARAAWAAAWAAATAAAAARAAARAAAWAADAAATAADAARAAAWAAAVARAAATAAATAWAEMQTRILNYGIRLLEKK